ncbi:MAG: nuclear transport factor 2 family protein [Chloroflexota bacterium]
MGEHANVALVRHALDAMNRGDMQAAADAIADDVEWHEIGRSEARHGKAALRDTMIGGTADFEIKVKVHDVIGGDDHTIALVEATATRGGRTLTYRTAEVFHVRDGKIAERWAFSDDTATITAFFA